MKLDTTTQASILLLGLLSSSGVIVEAFTPSIIRSHHNSVGATQLNDATLAVSREEDLMMTLRIIMDHQKRSTTVSKEEFIQQMEESKSAKQKKETTEVTVTDAEIAVDVSVPYDAAAKLAYESSEKSTTFEAFKAQYLTDSVAQVKAKQQVGEVEVATTAAAAAVAEIAVDVSVPYDAAAKLAYESSEKSTTFEAFKAQYLADSVAQVKAKQQLGEVAVATTTVAVAATMAAPSSSSSIDSKSEALIAQTKRLFDDDVKLGLADGGDCLADNFQFCAAVVGPIAKEPFIEALGGFKLEDSFDIEQNRFGFTVSPVQPNRVYFLTSNTATMTKDFMGVSPEDSPIGTNLVLPPECHHADFDENMKLTEYGFYTVDRQYGNTGGLGGAFGFIYAVGKGLPFPEAKPFKKSLQYSLFTWLGNKMTSRKKE